ncbi:MAG: hypothetical protein KGL52_14455 [Rhodospirillales bacterium]|nr:hypothetical protein [Rhodospirillales bacterium]
MRLPTLKALALAALPLLPAAAMLGLAPPAAAQIESREGIALRDQILQLRQELDALRARVDTNGGSYLGQARSAPTAPSSGTSDIVVQLLDRMNSMESEIRDLRGRVDELQNSDGQKIADLQKSLGDLKFEIANPGSAAPAAGGPGGNPAGSQGGIQPGAPRLAPKRTLAPPPPPHRAAAEERGKPAAHAGPLQTAYAALDRHDYRAAEHAARGVLAHRASPAAYDAQFVLAEALAGQHQWSRAAIAYDDAYNRGKHGPHAPAALLGLAQSLASINEGRAACETLAKLHAQYPREGDALKTQAAAVARRARCR